MFKKFRNWESRINRKGWWGGAIILFIAAVILRFVLSLVFGINVNVVESEAHSRT